MKNEHDSSWRFSHLKILFSILQLLHTSIKVNKKYIFVLGTYRWLVASGDKVRKVESAVLPGYDLFMIGRCLSCQLISYKLAIKRRVCEE